MATKNTKLRAGTRDNGDVYFYELNNGEDQVTKPFSSLELDLDGVPISVRVKGNNLILEKVVSGEKKVLVTFNVTKIW